MGENLLKKMRQILPLPFVLLTIVWAIAQEDPSAEYGFIKIFDGKTLKGWEGDPAYWKVENGNLVGEVTPDKPLKNNTFIIWRGGQTTDFELKGEFRLTESGNSGINYRSVEIDSVPFALTGYQADIDGNNRYTGQNYEERGRTTLAYRGQRVKVYSPRNQTKSLKENVKNNAWTATKVTGSLGTSESLKEHIKSGDWNEVHLVVKGNKLQHYVNGILMSEVTDNDTINRKLAGVLGIQVHVGPPMKVEYRNLRLKQL
ncbi:uncharacterized protein DUF1080 [Pontibacter ummariensis]|uniref:3-keto-alpha-glucoside-1,2-lyase/3-keto-2-hydroxy-glucal hydratase domain-containing protein n=1 Tax=Pontibacter ummariensis TaxID=1610492 RepID=A0A239LQF7_9BACT|nr:DUF1080 domain-containing protein [Pontibacter ummariensis]PRY02930.1 uncharacterized protein DUF1080 [Pontibacter ummariensis]SNT32098.1 protein of unknown function [Pontibacter ummariensis]